ncbi:MAG TPA: hypothetical protein VN891_03750 [Steroidobacteraceae bacterium]|jgi:hypothetical protein|nr:hypothetical protein [Steroidobacteraceae bacterium]
MAGEKMMTGAKVLLLCVVVAVAACNRDSGSAPVAHAVSQAKPKPAAPKADATAAEQTAGMVQAATQGKSQVPVELKFDIAQRPKVGQPLDINLALIAQISASSASLQVTGADDVSVAAGANQFDIPSEEAGQVYRQTVNVTPNAEGVLLLGVTVSLKHDEIVDQRVFSIPIIAER